MKMHSTLRMRGVSLIELMIALAIGTLLVLGLVEVFAASRTSYQLSEGMSRVQENGRFAVDYLQRDIRMAGHFGCVNDQAHARQDPAGLSTTFAAAPVSALQFGVSIQGYEATNTAPGAAVTLAVTPAKGGTAWTPALPVDIAAAIPDRVNGSDIIVLRYLAPEGVPITSISGTPSEPTFNFDKTRWDVLRSGVDNPGLFGVADCMNAAVFQATAGAATDGAKGMISIGAAPNNVVAFSKVFTPGQATLYRAESIIYYVGLSADTGRPSLYRLRFNAAPGDAVEKQNEELVEGVENMQMLYGQDRETDPTKSPSGYIEQLKTAGGIEVTSTPTPADAWRRVGLVQVGLVTASPVPAASIQAKADGARPLLAMGVNFTPPNDGRFRTAYQSTLALRNRLYGN